MCWTWKISAVYLLALAAGAGVASATPDDEQADPGNEGRVPISTYDDDPFVGRSRVESVADYGFERAEDGRRLLATDRVAIQEEPHIFRRDSATDTYRRFASNPWPCPPFPGDANACGRIAANRRGNFAYPAEERFPRLAIVRGPDGKPVLENGLQRWTPITNHLAMTTAFEAADSVLHAAEEWSGRHLAWGTRNPHTATDGRRGQLLINAHAFIDFNAFYSPSARSLFFGLVPYRLPDADPSDVRLFETSSSFEMVAHESGHAVHAAAKPNMDPADPGYDPWGESFGDQMAMWTSLRDPLRARRLLDEIGDRTLRSSNSLSRLGEAFAALVGTGTGVRDAWNEATVSTTSAEVHDRSTVLTGALYRLFTEVDAALLDEGATPLAALREAGRRMGVLTLRVCDYVPESAGTMTDVVKGYLKAEKELFGGRYHRFLVAELQRRGLLDASALADWSAHEAALPRLRLQPGATRAAVESFVQAHLAALGIGDAFGLRVQQVLRDRAFGQSVVRVQLMDGRGERASALGNFGILVFRADGWLADYHPPVSQGMTPWKTGLLSTADQSAVALDTLRAARAFGLEKDGGLLAFVRRDDGTLAMETHLPGGAHLESWVDVFSVEHPEGLRVDVRKY